MGKINLILLMAFLLLSSCSKNRTLQNPFNEEKADLPYYTEECGTEFPIFLEREWVQRELTSALKRKGILLQRDYLFQDDSVSVILDGYDPESRVGYIWMHEDNLEFDIVDYSWVEESILKEIQKFYSSNPNHNLSFNEAQYFFEKQRKGKENCLSL